MLRKVHIRLIVFILGTVLALGASPTNVLSVQSTVLYTAPHETTGSTNSLACMIINVSDEPRDVTVEIINTYGDVVKTDDITLEPGPRHAPLSKRLSRRSQPRSPASMKAASILEGTVRTPLPTTASSRRNASGPPAHGSLSQASQGSPRRGTWPRRG